MRTQPNLSPSSATPTALTEPDGAGFAPWLRPSGSTSCHGPTCSDPWECEDLAHWRRRERAMVALADLDDRYGHYAITALGVLGAVLIIWPAIRAVLP